MFQSKQVIGFSGLARWCVCIFNYFFYSFIESYKYILYNMVLVIGDFYGKGGVFAINKPYYAIVGGK